MRLSFFAALLSILISFSAFAHSHAPLADLNDPEMDRIHEIDRGDGKVMRITLRDAFQFSEFAHSEGRCGGFFDLTGQPNQKSLPTLSPMIEMFRLNLADRPMTQSSFLISALQQVDMDRVRENVQKLSAFRNRYYQSEHGVAAADWIVAKFQALGQGRADVRVEKFAHSWKQPSVIATIAGSGPKANEIVVIGAHEDSINQSAFGSSQMDAPGADDDASGVATVLEAFRLIAQSGFKPERTLKFMTYAAEEVGLRGSQDIANKMKADGAAVVAVAQFDMTAFPGAGDQVVFMTDFVNPELTRFSQRLLDTYVKVKWSNDQCGYACSDHASWSKAGYFSIMPFEATLRTDNKAIHSARDRLDLMDMAHGKHFVKLALSFLAELSKDSATR